MSDDAEESIEWRWVKLRAVDGGCGTWEIGRMTDSFEGPRVYLTNSEGSFRASSFEFGPRIQPPQGDEG